MSQYTDKINLQNEKEKKADITEEVLYANNLKEEKITFKAPSNVLNKTNLGEEALTKNNSLEQTLGNKAQSTVVARANVNEEVLYRSDLREEKLRVQTHSTVVPKADVNEEVLFRSDLREEKLLPETHRPYVEDISEAEEVKEEILSEGVNFDVDEEILYRSDLKEEKLAGISNNSDLDEEVLYKTDVREEKLSNKTHYVLSGNSDVKEEVLYKTYLREEKLSNKSHAEINDNLDVKEEVLYTSGYENIQIQENAVLKEENLEFMEPIIPSYVSEEVLYNDDGERLSINESEVINETAITNSEETLVDDALDSYDNQLSFDDIDINVNLDESGDEFATEKIVYKKKSFAEKMFDCDPIILERYDELKNLLLVYKKIKSRISNTCDTFKLGSTQLAKISTSGKSLKLYLNLDMTEVEPRLKCKEAGHKKAYEDVPVFLRIRSPRSMKNAKYLINQLATKFNLVENPKFTIVNSVELLKEKLK